MNKVLLVGRLTSDPKTGATAGGTAYARFSVAVDRKYKAKDNSQPTADFPNCLAWGKAAEFVEKYFTKGKRIGLEGRLQTGSYEKDGQKVYTTEVVVENVEFVESKGNAETGGDSKGAPQPDADGFVNVPDAIEEELPFN